VKWCKGRSERVLHFRRDALGTLVEASSNGPPTDGDILSPNRYDWSGNPSAQRPPASRVNQPAPEAGIYGGKATGRDEGTIDDLGLWVPVHAEHSWGWPALIPLSAPALGAYKGTEEVFAQPRHQLGS